MIPLRSWSEEPHANIGVSCDGLVVLDADSALGEDQIQRLALPETTTVRTPRGQHRYFRGRARNRVDLLPDVDVRAGAGYVVGAGSVHPSGARYLWELAPWEVEPARAPRELLEFINRSQRDGRRVRRMATRTPGAPIEQGRRNTELTRLAGVLRRGDVSLAGLEAALAAENDARCNPPLDREELDRIIASAARFAGPPQWIADPFGFPAGTRLDAKARHVLLLLTLHANDEGVCWPGLERLAALSGLHRNTVRAAIAILEAASRIHVQRRRRRPHLFRLMPYDSSFVPKVGGSSGTIPVHQRGGAR